MPIVLMRGDWRWCGAVRRACMAAPQARMQASAHRQACMHAHTADLTHRRPAPAPPASEGRGRQGRECGESCQRVLKHRIASACRKAALVARPAARGQSADRQGRCGASMPTSHPGSIRPDDRQTRRGRTWRAKFALNACMASAGSKSRGTEKGNERARILPDLQIG
eukprot:358642-Chlamydomonas_euryale.AAC.3